MEPCNIFNIYLIGFWRLTDFVISVSNSSTEEADCGGVYNDTVPKGGNVTIQCGQVGRYVHFRRVNESLKQNHFVTLCEVEVFGHRKIGKAGYFAVMASSSRNVD